LNDPDRPSPDIDELIAEWRQRHTVPAAPAPPPQLPAPAGPIDRDQLLDYVAQSQQQTGVLREFGQALLAILSDRPDASQPMPTAQVTRLLNARRTGERDLTPREVGVLINDAIHRGFTPGLVTTRAGYAIAETHFSFKQTRHRDAKAGIARAAAGRVAPGQRVGLDGGSTTLPVAEALIARLDAGQLTDLTVVTNSLPVVERFLRFVEERGWSDSEAPVRVLVCAGLLRPNTQALAEVVDGRRDCLGSLTALVEAVGGLDWTFVGANGITAAEGITMNTALELRSKPGVPQK
jgi:hypothetical protein